MPATLTPRPHVGFVIEPILGHLTHARNLQALVPERDEIRPTFYLVPFSVDGLAARTPGYRSNWSLRAGLRARRAMRSIDRAEPLDALFVHTQVPAVLAPDWVARVPTVVSVDATPRQYDELGLQYDHAVGRPPVEWAKHKLNTECFTRARRIVAWSTWAKDGLVADYGVPSDKVVVVPPGVRTAWWHRPVDPAAARDDVVRILFVGGDLERKGGHVLLEAARRLRARADGPAVEVHLVTGADVEPEDGVVVHHGVQPNSDELRALYHRADIFCLPTYGDCLPMVLSEAGAAGLPLVATAVGGIGEIVRPGETGVMVPVGDADALAAELARLIDAPDLRRRLGDGARALVDEHFDAERNAAVVVELLREVAAEGRSR